MASFLAACDDVADPRADPRADPLDAERWRRGMTGAPKVDAAMRAMDVTGSMHIRPR